MLGPPREITIHRMGDLNRGERRVRGTLLARDPSRSSIWARCIPAAVAGVSLAVTFAASASAPVADRAEVDELNHAQLTAVLGEDFTRNADGLFRVHLPSGGSVLSHGPDPRSSMNQLDLEA